MLQKKIAIKIMGLWILFVVLIIMAWQVTPALAGFTPTPETPTNTPITPTNTPITPTNTLVPATATGLTPTATSVAATATSVTATVTPITATVTPGVSPTQSPPENTPEMPVTGGQVSGLSNSGMGAALILGMMILLIVAISLAIRQVARTKTKI